MKLKVCEIFESLQGEGARVGEPSLFLRLSGCNLKCHCCDTKYSWNEFTEYPLDELVRIVESSGLTSVVITGGEPTLQAKGLIEFLNKLDHRELKSTIETNGMLLDKTIIDLFNKVDLISLSLKPPLFAYQILSLDNVWKIVQIFQNKVYLKVPLTDSSEDVEWMDSILKELDAKGVRVEVFIQPNSFFLRDFKDYIEVSRRLWKLSLNLSKKYFHPVIRFIPQQHRLFFWDVTKGI